MARTTMAPMLWPLMDLDDVTPGFCAVCGRAYPTERHHVVRRSAGELCDEGGKARRKPVVELCGFGNNLRDADGSYFCHGLAHAGILHFRNGDGHLEYLMADAPCKYLDALDMPGWKRAGRWS